MAIIDVSADQERLHGSGMLISVHKSITAAELVKVACEKFAAHKTATSTAISCGY